MSTLMIPDSLKLALRSLYRSDPCDDGKIREIEKDHEWTIIYSYSEWSGYHDENNYYSYTTTVLDHEPALPDTREWYCAKMLPRNREMYEKLLSGYSILEICEFQKSCGYPEYYNKTIIKIDSVDPEYQYTRPLWILDDSSKSR